MNIYEMCSAWQSSKYHHYTHYVTAVKMAQHKMFWLEKKKSETIYGFVCNNNCTIIHNKKNIYDGISVLSPWFILNYYNISHCRLWTWIFAISLYIFYSIFYGRLLFMILYSIFLGSFRSSGKKWIHFYFHSIWFEYFVVFGPLKLSSFHTIFLTLQNIRKIIFFS